jgi:hypothetical protein
MRIWSSFLCGRLRSALLLLAVLALNGGCLLQPAPLPPLAATPPGPIHLSVADEQLREVVCPAFTNHPAIRCEGVAGPEGAGAVPTVHLEARLLDSSRDGWRNAGISLVSFTTALVVSTSGTVEFIATETGPGSRTTTRHAWRGEGRVGMWSVIPFYTGFAGTMIGTALNEYRLPERLRADCALLRTGQDLAADLPPDFDPCAEYRAFLRDSYATVHAPLSELLARTNPGPAANRAERFANGERE